jgi:hypothetical protein
MAQQNPTWFTTTDLVYLSMVHDHWLSQICHYLQPLAIHSAQWFITNGSTRVTVIHTNLLHITHRDSQSLAQHIAQCFRTTGFSIAHNELQPMAQQNTTLFRAINTAQLTMVHDHWLIQISHDLQPLAKHSAQWFTNNGSCSIHYRDSQHLDQHNTPWFTVTGSE